MKNKIVFFSPSTQISGGVKVILRLAYLLGETFDVTLVTDSFSQSGLDRILPYGVQNRFKIISKSDPNWQNAVAEAAVAINYGDANPRLVPVQTKQILYFQGIVSDRELPNIQSFKYAAIVTVSPALADIVKKNSNVPVYCVPPGVDSIFTPMVIKDKPSFAIGALYHKAKLKNTMLAVAGVNTYFRKHCSPFFLYLLTASGIPAEFLSRISIPYKLFINPPQNVIHEMYCSCSVWISTSRNEGLGLPVLEAMACGVPVLWLPNQGLKDLMVDNENCLFIGNTSDSVVKALHKIRQNPLLVRKLVQNGMKVAQRFRWETTVQKFTEVINRVISK